MIYGATYMVNNKVVPITKGLHKSKRHRIEIHATRVPEGISLEMKLVPESPIQEKKRSSQRTTPDNTPGRSA